jgi:molybdopterin converting factor small subunit
MKLRVMLFGTLRSRMRGYDPGKGIEIDMTSGSTVEEMVRCLGLSPDEAGVVLVKGVCKRFSEPLEDGDEVNIFQPIGGG